MNVFLEYLSKDIAIARGGPSAFKWGDPYEYACVVVLHPESKEAEIKALVADGGLTAAHAKPLFRILHSIGYTPYWERIKCDTNNQQESSRLMTVDISSAIAAMRQVLTTQNFKTFFKWVLSLVGRGLSAIGSTILTLVQSSPASSPTSPPSEASSSSTGTTPPSTTPPPTGA